MKDQREKILVGTSKGLIILGDEAGGWKIKAVHFVGMPVSMIYVDERNDCWWVCLSHRHWGSKLHRSMDKGKHWEEVPMPVYPDGAEIKSGKQAELKKIWCMSHGGEDRPNVLWLGTEPGGLFYSEDNGNHFRLVESLWNHPSRMDQNQWFGAGRDDPFLHSIIIDPRDSNHIYIAVSCAGVFESKDGGINWQAKNKGLIAAYLPNPNVEVGHDPHRLLICPANPDIHWQQNHCGIFRSENGGTDWKLISDPKAKPHYGFGLCVDEFDPNQAWVIPATSDEIRVPNELKLTVYHTKDGGNTWSPQQTGLPKNYAFDIVFRHSFIKKRDLLAFGTTNGNLYLSKSRGKEWACISNNLARIDYLTFA